MDDIFETRDHSIESQINLIIQSFDFISVKKIFDFMGYTYLKNPTEEYQPSIEDIVYLVENLLLSAANRGKKRNINMTVASGRFEAFWNNDEETLSLKFIPYESEIMFDEEAETIYAM